jgi:putative isomerase
MITVFLNLMKEIGTRCSIRHLAVYGFLFIIANTTESAQIHTESSAISRLQDLIGPTHLHALTPRLQEVNHDILTKGLHPFPGASGNLLTGYSYGEYYDWDLYFENIYLSYYGISPYDFTNFKVFLDRQEPDGFVSRTLVKPRTKQMFKPFLAQIAVLGSKQNGNDYEWLRAKYYLRLKMYLNRWFKYDEDGNGLPAWNSADASGMDNQVSRGGPFDSYTDEGVDLACYLYRELQAMQVIAARLGKSADAKEYETHARLLAKSINSTFWDAKDGFYYDRNERTGQQIRVKTVVGFLPLWAGIASPGQAKRLIQDHLINPKEFWAAYPIATYAMTEPDFYEGVKSTECNWRGNAWIPTNYMIFHGLIEYGYTDIAKQLAMRTFEMALDNNKVTREFYNSDTGSGNGMNPFWGWSSLAYVMPLDFIQHYDPMDIHGNVKPLLSQDLGVTFVDPS